VVWHERIWLTTATEDGRELSYVAVDRESGEIVRDEVLFRVARPLEKHKFNTYASPTPVIEEGRVYLSWGSSGLACLDETTASVLWVRRDLECDHYRGPGSSPILDGDRLILQYDGFDYQFVICLDKLTGDTLWRTERPLDFGTNNGDQKKAYGTPLLINAGGRRQLISPTSKGVFAYDPAAGRELWHASFEQFSPACRPLFDGRRVYLNTGFGKAELLAIDPTGSGDVTASHVIWRELRSMPSKPSPLLIDGLLYTIHDQGVMSCLVAETGEVVWQSRVGGNYSASPLYGDGRIYLFSEEGKGTVLRPGRAYDVLAENELADGCLASPAAIDGALFVRTRSHLYRLQEGAGQPAATSAGR
jgi:outer membrane protein assembly factor BamB